MSNVKHNNPLVLLSIALDNNLNQQIFTAIDEDGAEPAVFAAEVDPGLTFELFIQYLSDEERDLVIDSKLELFMRRYGNLVRLTDTGEVISLFWPIEVQDELIPFFEAIEAVRDLVETEARVSQFMVGELDPAAKKYLPSFEGHMKWLRALASDDNLIQRKESIKLRSNAITNYKEAYFDGELLAKGWAFISDHGDTLPYVDTICATYGTMERMENLLLEAKNEIRQHNVLAKLSAEATFLNGKTSSEGLLILILTLLKEGKEDAGVLEVFTRGISGVIK